jgi:hypothetical protein
MLSERIVESIAREVLPGCRPNMGYSSQRDQFVLQVNFGEEVTQIEVPRYPLLLSWNDFAEWLKTQLPPEWFPKTPAADAIDFDLTG